MIVSLIVAASENDVIGKDNKLPWSLPKDLAYFRSITQGHPVIMGRKTYESIGRPLPNRVNIVLTSKHLEIKGCKMASSLPQALTIALETNPKEVFVIGGKEVFGKALEQSHVDRIYLTRVHTQIDGDVSLPPIDWSKWHAISFERHEADATHAYPFTFYVYERA
ncbi:MAG TPA: dihydrofolate reductase [Candidatus Peribacteria bacterium]|nr:dihydrofolate reductase [Candidatus Peribacteria bacterium]